MKRSSIAILAGVAALTAGAFVYSNQSGNKAEPGNGPPLVSVTVPELSAEEKKGEVAFNNNCATCHGKDAAGQDGVAPPLIHPIYEPSHHGDQAFFMAAENGSRAHHWPFGDMPRVEGVTRPEVADIVTYVRALQRANGIN